ncbi:hypothetical protein COV06_02240 [Candidatus Uhrbacteria bacterium CG10_big_fil_rev_8_21_14_0_10_50_16]|uniref:DUF5667 domain-containing protein n=1 Tax=Candidatus Uhrbacteria bacterium CG10_big_fil_rev_8_21_14_0_10_50_16 TaxID=1975039 RepID=A0A2H0RMA1_9BACT|nr:MAG: hypothetical protein COV06_02240 [Candidatus Uhrbacteria bacterium CG10_big_fil_rev_8_21_14_0_10_50_16]
MQNQLHNLLTEIKDSSHAGRVDGSFSASLREKILQQGVQSIITTQPRPMAMVDFLIRIPGELTDMVARPVALASLLMAMVLGGWITGVNASLSTVPGDALYGIKLVSEQAQLSLASSNTRAKLHDEFASRRLSEVERLIHSGAPTSDGRVQTALDGFQKQMDGVEESLGKVQDATQSVELARIIDKKSEELEVVLELTAAVQDSAAHDAVAGNVTKTEEVQGQVVETLAGQVDDSQVTRLELQRRYSDEVRDMSTRSALLVERIDRIEHVLASRETTRQDFNANQLRYQATQIDLVESQSLAARDIYPEAFKLLANERIRLRGIADQLLQIEIALSAPESIPATDQTDDQTSEENTAQTAPDTQTVE